MTLVTADRFCFHESVFVAPSAIITGEVSLGAHTSIWFQSLLRGDVDRIEIGPECNIQDGSIIHTTAGSPTILGCRVSFGHGVIAHGCVIGDNVLVGIRATILNGATIGENCLIAAGAMVLEDAVIPPNSIVMGMPGKVVGEVSAKHRQMIAYTAEHYVAHAREYRQVLPSWRPLDKWRE